MKKNLLLGASALMLASVVCAPAFAQGPQPPQTTASADEDNNEVSEVVVQVNKRDESVQDVPVTVTAYTPEQRDTLGIISIFDFTRATPSFEYSTALDRSFIRGVGRNTNAPGTQAGIAIYVDGVYTPSTYGLDRAVILSGNYEADAGPQGTLFGRNAIGGVLQQNSAHATDQFEVKTDLRYNDHNRIDVAASVGGPINENFKLLFGVDFRKQTEGYFQNVYLKQDTAGPTEEYLASSILDYKFGTFDGFLKVEALGFNRKLSQYSQYGSNYLNLPLLNNDTTSSSTGLIVNNYFNCAAPTRNPNGTVASCPTTGAQVVSGYYDPTNVTALNNYNIKNDYRTNAKSRGDWNLADQTTWHAPWFDIKYIGGYNQYIYDNHQDGDGTARGVFQYDPDGPAGALPAATIYPNLVNYYEDRAWYSHELNFSSTGEGPLNWIAGLYYYHDDFLNNYTQYSMQQSELTTIAGVNNPRGNHVDLWYNAVTESEAAFAQVDYQLAPKWTVTGGVRWNRDDVETEEQDHYYSFVPSAFNYNPATGKYVASDSTAFIKATCAPAGVAPITDSADCSVDAATNTRFISKSWDGYGGMVNLSYKPNDDTLAYFKYSRGYKAGGIVLSSMAVQPVLDAESLNSYEAGLKLNPNRRLTLNSTLYYYDYHNYQDFGSVANPVSLTGFSTIGFNVPKSRNYGAELIAYWHPTSQFSVTMTGNYMNAKVTDGGTLFLVDNLDPTASGKTEIKDAAGNVIKTYSYKPQPCGAKVGTRQPQCITGVSLKGASPWKVWITPSYRFDFEKGSLDLLATYSWRAGNVSAYSRNPIYESPSYDEVDLRAVWHSDGRKYQVIAFVNNVFDDQGTEFVLPNSNNGGNPYIQNVLTIPRTWGLELQAKF